MRKAIRYILSLAVFSILFFSGAQSSQHSNANETISRPKPAGIAKRGQSEQRLSNPPKVTAKFVPDSIGIGDRFTLEVEVRKDLMQMVGFPEFHNGKMGEVIEIVSESGVDTLERDGRKITLRKKYELTSFDEGWYSMGLYPMLYAEKNITDTIWSADSLFLKVGTYEIDTATMTIYDIKQPMRTPLKVGEISGYVLLGIALLAILAAIIWLIFTRRHNMSLLGKPKPVIPPHVIAIKALESLHHQKLWQNNKHKLYYTGITEILREYIEKRYGINAKEMTSHEIMASLENEGLPAKNYNELKGLLECADLVKFAKFTPDADYNEAAYGNAYYFVEATKLSETEPTEMGSDEEERMVENE